MTSINGKNLFSDGKNHLDIYLNFVCNLRCNHCFIGNELERKDNFKIESAIALLQYARGNGCTDVSFLGGEPTLYKDLPLLVDLAFDLGYVEVKIITNGLKSFTNFIRKYSPKSFRPTIVFSVDGSSKETFEKIRGRNTFDLCHQNMNLATSLGYECAGIISVSNDNLKEVIDIVKEFDSKSFRYVNVHHVNSLGFAQSQNIVNVTNWINLRHTLIALSPKLLIKVKFERKFVMLTESNPETHCVIEEESGGNIMVFPDGRVYRCALFFSAAGLNSLIWDGIQMSLNSEINEQLICGESLTCNGCCATNYLGLNKNEEINQSDYKTVCMYRKEVI